MNEAGDQNGPADYTDQPTPRPEPIPESNTPNADPATKRHQGKQQNPLDRALVHWTRIVGIFTFVLAVVGGVQAWAFIESERAAIYPQIDSIISLEADKTPIIIIEVLNTGRSQAFLAETRVKGWVGELPEEPDYLDIKSSVSGVVPPHGGRVLRMGPMTSLNWGQVDDVKRGALKLYIFGYVRFTDSFSLFGPKTIGFCALYIPSAGAPGLSFDDCQRPEYSYSK